MSTVYHDAEYVHQIAHHLERFKQKDRLKWNFRCPICGDSKKSTIKARGYIQEGRDGKGLWFSCYNCERNWPFSELLKHLEPGLFLKYQADRFRPKKTKQVDHHDTETDLEAFAVERKIIPVKKTSSNSKLYQITALSPDHMAVEYLVSREIPKRQWKRLYFTRRLNEILGDEQKFPEPRIVFPCNKFSGETFGYTGRLIGDGKGLRYKTGRLCDDLPLIFGLDRVKLDETVLVTEGPIDSLFLPNSIAACCSNLASIENILKVHEAPVIPKMVLVYDNERRNPQIVRLMTKAVEKHFSLVIWPEWIEQKDVNEMVQAGVDVLSVIEEHTYSGLKAKLKLGSWVRCDRHSPEQRKGF